MIFDIVSGSVDERTRRQESRQAPSSQLRGSLGWHPGCWAVEPPVRLAPGASYRRS